MARVSIEMLLNDKRTVDCSCLVCIRSFTRNISEDKLAIIPLCESCWDIRCEDCPCNRANGFKCQYFKGVDIGG